MEFRQLRYFVSIADLGSVSRASRALHIAQPALSQQLAQLEAELGHALLLRRSSGVVLTDHGREFYRHAQRILKQLAQVPAALDASAGEPAGDVAIGLPQSTAAQYAMPLLAALAGRHPRIRLELFDEISGNLLAGLDSGRLDLAVLVGDEDAALAQAVPLLEEELYLISRAGAAPRGRSVRVAALARLPLTLPGAGQGVRGLVEQVVRAQGQELPRPRVVANSMSIMRQAMRDGIAHSVMPWGAVADDLQAGTLVAQPLSPRLKRRAWLAVARDAEGSAAMEAVAQVLGDVVRERIAAGAWPGSTLP
ncbi:LysR substrate-binding domain-containing protein [Caenimonas sedimenti]|nr:LysR substrate-binding domain-containing protein [Caenimonas sedimenti]